MKIYTITCHNVYNVGASLQAYALLTYLKELGHDAEIIDYKPDYLSHHYSLWGINNHVYDKPVIRVIYNLAKLPGRIKRCFSRRKKEFDAFTSVYLATTEKRYTSNAELKKNPPMADIIFAGSDQIWNTVFQNGKDPAFYLDFADEKTVKASYAASFATGDIAEECKPKVKKWLSNLDAISVRESSGIDILKKMGFTDAIQVLDPVFLLSKEEWGELEEPIQVSKPYVLLYDFDSNVEFQSKVKALADQKGWQVYSVLPCSIADKCFDQYGPRVFLSLVKNAQVVVSNSFHATAFSLIYHKNFFVFDRNEEINTRMRDLVKMMGIENRVISNGQFTNLAIDYDVVSERLEREIIKSRSFIDQVIAMRR